jgi:hypothetical protein
MATIFCDGGTGGSDAANGLSFANRKKTFGGASAIATAGDTVRIKSSPDPTSLGQNATFTNKSATLTLTSAVTVNISTCESAWTASANVTCSTTSTRKEGTLAVTHAFASGFTTGLAAYFATGTLDLSAYQQISFWIKVTSTTAANTLRIDLCSDTAGATPVNSFTIDFALPSSVFIPITYDNGSALGSAIQSVALNCLLDPGTITVTLDNIIACKASSSADSLNLRSLVGKNTAGELWYPIRSINGTTVKLDTKGSDDQSTTAKGYSGTTATTTCYKRECTIYATSSSTAWGTTAGSGTSGNLITYSGGWNTTDMSTQTGETFVDALTNNPDVIISSHNFVAFEKLYGVRAANGFSLSGTDGTLSDVGGYGCERPINLTGNNWACSGTLYGGSCRSAMVLSGSGTGTNDSYVNITSSSTAGNTGVTLGSNSSIVTITGTLKTNNNNSDGVTLAGTGFIATAIASDNTGNGITPTNAYGTWTIGSITANSNSSYGLGATTGAWLTVNAWSSTGNSTAALNFAPPHNSFILLKSPTYAETNFYTSTIPQGSDSRIQIENLNGAANTHLTQLGGGKIESETSVRHTASGLAWKLSPTATYRNTNYPIRLLVGEYGVNASALVTVTAWVRRTSSAVSARITVPGGQIAGVATDVSTSSTGAGIGAYEQLTLTFTPSASGVFQVFFDAYGGTTASAYVDDVVVTQA